MARAMARPMAQPMSAPSTRVMAVVAQAELEEHHQGGQTECEADVRQPADRQRLKNRRRIRDCGDEQAPCERKPGH